MAIRRGEKKDLPQVLNLVKELAIYEKAPNEVEVTVSQMEEWGFGSDKIFDFFVAENNGKIVGIALYYYKYSTWKGKCLFLEDIIVTESERKNGFGKLLFEAVVQVAKNDKVKRMEWQVLEWNEHAIKFYKKTNTVFDEEWVNCKLTYEEIQKM
ncbi:MAG: GNAT family N-acetyltransferase [Sphingobacteriaceae bacterium]|nr:GNAT family N-acetyltransferase [Sphingobacteriaceae bacterium]